MPLYGYKAMDKKGNIYTGSSEATDLDDLIGILRNQNLFLVEGKPQKVTAPVETPRPTTPEPQAPIVARSIDAVPLKLVAVFTNELVIMVRTALPILESLENLAKQQSHPKFKAILTEIYKSVREGKSLSNAFSRYPKAFTNIYISLLSAGETAGNLSVMLERIVSYLNFQLELKSKVRSALLYPVIVIATSIAVVAFLVLFILPTFMDVFSQLGVDLPLPTRILLGFSAHFRKRWPFYIIGVFLAWQLFKRWLTNPQNRRTFDAFMLNTPIVGPVIRAIVITRILRTLASLLSSGVPILQALELARAAAGNTIYSELIGQVYRSASQGAGVAPALSQTRYFPQAVANMISNAEKTGSLPEVLNQVADFYEKETDTTLKNLFSAIEPIFVVFLGLMVGGIAIAILLPIFQMGGAIQ